MRAKEPQESPQCRRHRLNVGAREPLRLCDDDLAEELGALKTFPVIALAPANRTAERV
jgi:hypothetical protein